MGRRHGMSIADLQPFGVLVEHRIDDVDERLVAGEEAVPAGQEIAFQPTLALVLAQHLHHPAIRGKVFIGFEVLGIPCFWGHFEYIAKPIRSRLVGPEDAEVLAVVVELHHVG